jgi:NADPH:quinone reductase-like Zn-dependent oxidoreductase
MKAIRIHHHGGPEVLKIDDVPTPEPIQGQVRVRLHATSLNHMDIWVRKGLPGAASPPLILGCDGSGIIEALGEGVKNIVLGDRVFIFPMMTCGKCPVCLSGQENLCRDFQIFGEHQNGTHCEFICVPQENILKLDAGLSFFEGAAFPLVFLTAWRMLVTNGSVKKGDDVLIVGAASGIGSAAIQIVKSFGARVIATAGNLEKMEQARALGADFVLDHYKESVAKHVKEITHKKGVDIVFEHVGAKIWDECLKSLAWGGKLVTCGATSGPHVSMDLRHIFIKQQKIIGSTMGTKAEMLRVQEWMSQKKIRPVVGKIFPWFEVENAHRYLEESEHFGKVVLNWM